MSHLPEAIDWGCPNKVYQPVLAPTASKRAREKTGDYVPARPDWICITAPEHDASFAPGSTKEPSDAELAARAIRAEAVAEERKLLAIARQEQSEIRHREWMARKALERSAREKLAIGNKAKGWGGRKSRNLSAEAREKKRIQARELSARRKSERDAKASAIIPIGYVKISQTGTAMSRTALTMAAKDGRIPGIKILEVWYCDQSAAIKYASTLIQRQKERAALNSRKQRMVDTII